jgi:hypothetical protein
MRPWILRRPVTVINLGEATMTWKDSIKGGFIQDVPPSLDVKLSSDASRWRLGGGILLACAIVSILSLIVMVLS